MEVRALAVPAIVIVQGMIKFTICPQASGWGAVGGVPD